MLSDVRGDLSERYGGSAVKDWSIARDPDQGKVMLSGNPIHFGRDRVWTPVKRCGRDQLNADAKRADCTNSADSIRAHHMPGGEHVRRRDQVTAAVGRAVPQDLDYAAGF